MIDLDADAAEYRANWRKNYIKRQKPAIGYMCQIAWDHEIGADKGGTTIYSSLEALKAAHPMWEECGIVEVMLNFNTVIAWGEV